MLIDVLRQRATSPSQQSMSICSWPNSSASRGPAKPGTSSDAATHHPVMIIRPVTPLAEMLVRSSIHVT
jgi:hypothetical protein